MADLIVQVVGMGPGASSGSINYNGNCRASSMTNSDPNLYWNIDVPATALALTVNAACKDAGIAVCAANGFTIGLLDKKTIIGSAVGL